jgi:hypothetical protein
MFFVVQSYYKERKEIIMLLYYSIAKEGKYKKDDNGNYINCVIALSVAGDEPKQESDRIHKAREQKEWLSKQIEINPFFILPITKEQYDKTEAETNG